MLLKKTSNTAFKPRSVPQIGKQSENSSDPTEKSNRKRDFRKAGLKNPVGLLCFHPDKRIDGEVVFSWASDEFEHVNDRLDAEFVGTDEKQDFTSLGKVGIVRGRTLQRLATPPKHRLSAPKGARRRWVGKRPPRGDEQLVPDEFVGYADSPKKTLGGRQEFLLARFDLGSRRRETRASARWASKQNTKLFFIRSWPLGSSAFRTLR